MSELDDAKREFQQWGHDFLAAQWRAHDAAQDNRLDGPATRSVWADTIRQAAYSLQWGGPP